MSEKEKQPERPMEQRPPEESKKEEYLFDFFEFARKVVIPGRDGDHIYMFKPTAGLYFVQGFYFIKIEDSVFKVGENPETGEDVLEHGKFIKIVTQHNELPVRAYTIRQADFEDESLDEILLYFDAATARVFHRFTRRKVKVFDEGDRFKEEAEVSGKGVELKDLDLKEVPPEITDYPDYA